MPLLIRSREVAKRARADTKHRGCGPSLMFPRCPNCRVPHLPDPGVVGCRSCRRAAGVL
jgi:hypothetical protein